MTSTVVKAGAFGVVSLVFAVMLALMMRGGAPSGAEYSALFADASQLKENEDVRAAGVRVGRVTSVEVQDDNLVRVGFELQDGFPITSTTEATVKYKNLLGDRFLSLAQGVGGGEPLRPGGVIGAERTHPALSLDELYNGFAPLFEGLQPDQVNKLTGSLVMALQGEGAALSGLLAQTGSLTGTLAEKDQVIGSLIDNLNGAVGTVDAHRPQLDALVTQVTTLARGLNSDRERIGDSLKGINDLTASVSDLLREARPELKGVVHQVDRVAEVINNDSDELDTLLKRAPAFYPVLGRLGSYSAAFQFYVCGLNIAVLPPGGNRVTQMIPGAPAPNSMIDISAGAPRCRF
jgi:phospholipid/cholesterol/gamma-HCH transport system substrate-binding protein